VAQVDLFSAAPYEVSRLNLNAAVG